MRLDAPLEIVVDGMSRRGVVMKEGKPFEVFGLALALALTPNPHPYPHPHPHPLPHPLPHPHPHPHPTQVYVGQVDAFMAIQEAYTEGDNGTK